MKTALARIGFATTLAVSAAAALVSERAAAQDAASAVEEVAAPASGAAADRCGAAGSWFAAGCERIMRVATEGTWDLYITGYGWHIDGYTGESKAALNADSWGAGAGKHWTDESGNEDILFAFVFRDSHDHPEPIGGYARQWYTPPVLGGLSLGGGGFAGLTARDDILSYFPVPLALPVASLRYGKASAMGTVVPRIPGVNKGNVGFFWGRYEF